MLFKCPKKLNAVDYSNILNNYGEKMHFQNLIVNQDNASAHKSKIIDIFFQEKEWNVLEWAEYILDLNAFKNFWAVVKYRLQKLAVFWENFEKKCQKF